MTKISFIVVAYNAAQSLDALLGDLLSQTIAPAQLEALLVDSASTDGPALAARRGELRRGVQPAVIDRVRLQLRHRFALKLPKMDLPQILDADLAHARIEDVGALPRAHRLR